MVVIMTSEEFKKFKNNEIEKGEIIFDIKDLEKAFEAGKECGIYQKLYFSDGVKAVFKEIENRMRFYGWKDRDIHSTAGYMEIRISPSDLEILKKEFGVD